MVRENRIIGEDADGIIIDMETIGGRFDNDRFLGIGDDPVEFAEREFGTKIVIIEIHVGKFGAGFGNAGTSAKKIGDELVGGDVVLAGDLIKIDGITSEHETGDAKTLIIDGVVVKGIVMAVGVRNDIGDTNDGVMLGEGGESLELEWEMVRRNGDGFVVGIIEVEITPEISVFSLVDD